LGVACRTPAGDRGAERAADFAALDGFVRASYCYLETKATDWERVVAELAPRAREAEDEVAFLHVLEDALDQLYDGHCMLGRNAADSWRPVPHGLWVERRNGRALVAAVQRGSQAARAGVRPGDELVGLDGTPFDELVRARRPRHLSRPDPAAEDWALASAAAGRHDSRGAFRVRRDGGELELVALSTSEPRPLVEWRRLEGGVGWIALASFGDEDAIALFDQALEELRDAPALVLDVRSNSGGDTAIARPILGRFLAARAQYAWMARREGARLGPRWPEFVEPRGPWTYTGPLVVLVDRFSVSMAEGFAMALQGLGRARVVGTPMARLGAAIGRIELPHSRIGVQLSTEPVYALDGTPRDELVPDVLVDPLAARASVE
jgi:carboxyl-terminal processing protease